MRPRTIAEIVGQQKILAAGTPLHNLASNASASAISVILWGPPGSGKTTIAQVIARESGKRFVELSAVTAGVKDVREVIEQAKLDGELCSSATILFLDEIHRFTKAQQDALLPGVENGWITLIAATTENPSFSVITPLLSRSLLLRLESLTDSDVSNLVARAAKAPYGLDSQYELEEQALEAIVQFASGDARRALTSLEAAAGLADSSKKKKSGQTSITAENVYNAVDRALLRYDKTGDHHYDVISAFIKSIRGSDPDAAIHYLARMIEAGEDPRFIARRLIISAAEDIGLADPQALVITTAAADAVAFIGMPEGRIPLAEATIYLATAPKSNTAYKAIGLAIGDIREGKGGEVPMHLRSTAYRGANDLGNGKGYVYPHDDELGVVQQQYLPESLKNAEYYSPAQHGSERQIAARLAKIRKITRGED